MSPSVVAHAEPLDPRPMIFGTREGIWLPTNQGAACMDALVKRPKTDAVIDAQDKLILKQAEQIRTATTAVARATRAQKVTQAGLADATKLAHEKEAENQKLVERQDSWTRSPFLWIGVGGAIATSLIVLATQIVKAAQ